MIYLVALNNVRDPAARVALPSLVVNALVILLAGPRLHTSDFNLDIDGSGVVSGVNIDLDGGFNGLKSHGKGGLSDGSNVGSVKDGGRQLDIVGVAAVSVNQLDELPVVGAVDQGSGVGADYVGSAIEGLPDGIDDRTVDLGDHLSVILGPVAGVVAVNNRIDRLDDGNLGAGDGTGDVGAGKSVCIKALSTGNGGKLLSGLIVGTDGILPVVNAGTEEFRHGGGFKYS